MTPKIYRRKILPIHYNNIVSGYKNFEIRKEDPEKFEEFTLLDLYEWENGEYTGNVVRVGILHVTRDVEGLQPGFAVLGINIQNIYTTNPQESQQ